MGISISKPYNIPCEENVMLDDRLDKVPNEMTEFASKEERTRYIKGLGNVFILQYGNGNNHDTTSIFKKRKHHHYSVLVDLRNESTIDTTTGLELHLIVADNCDAVRYRCAYRSMPMSMYPRVYVGTLDKALLEEGTDRHRPSNLQRPQVLRFWGEEKFDQFISEIDGSTAYVKWSKQANCLSFARRIVKELELSWPSNLPMTNSFYPWLPEWYIAANNGLVIAVPPVVHPKNEPVLFFQSTSNTAASVVVVPPNVDQSTTSSSSESTPEAKPLVGEPGPPVAQQNVVEPSNDQQQQQTVVSNEQQLTVVSEHAEVVPHEQHQTTAVADEHQHC
ncbi:hypothetical protein SAMD00019534_038450 [Acytostelium subglobosum LB1]|uniref:hypothetical protein n=1 Tax=Acytostelium subglobosum LB1 TaxID=1410327 RepID=UPI0006451749|nr:hypothetical protein SAMD00019534_038450 [Acytostelium subglobosum LB1]GAM20670.1 hypothetical protein SAMD00019534_038450 [Acytostelium subglobosum LB1]|eukprot:XP_012760191.1 hypothetical protein SAMD00019534_038450 [Acytostelium subglobosum LB1]